MPKSYKQYCPIAHALDLVGERWALLVVRELLFHGPLRYSDLHERLPGCGTNILATRLKDLEAHGIIRKHRLPPPAASTVYELTDYGRGLRRTVQELARWGVRSLGPPSADDSFDPGWLLSALVTITGPLTSLPAASVEFRVGEELAGLAEGVAREGPIADADAVVETDPIGFYHLFVDADLDGVAIQGSREAVEQLVAAAGLAPAASLVAVGP
jgi:DNA-binding HxlR family transcriptional regulator